MTALSRLSALNLVNVERDKTVRSATFDRGRREATIRF